MSSLINGYVLRSLEPGDYLGYSQLMTTDVGRGAYDTFIRETLSPDHQIVVIENEVGELVGAGTIFIEKKLTHGGSLMGHIENIFIREESRRRGLGERLVKHLISLARTRGCYRVDLNCVHELESFYEKSHFRKNQISMCVLIEENFS